MTMYGNLEVLEAAPTTLQSPYSSEKLHANRPSLVGDKWQNIEGAVSDLCGCAVNLKKTLTRFSCFSTVFFNTQRKSCKNLYIKLRTSPLDKL